MGAKLVRWKFFLCIFWDNPLYMQKEVARPHICWENSAFFWWLILCIHSPGQLSFNIFITWNISGHPSVHYEKVQVTNWVWCNIKCFGHATCSNQLSSGYDVTYYSLLSIDLDLMLHNSWSLKVFPRYWVFPIS